MHTPLGFRQNALDLDQPVGIGALGPFALRVFRLEPLVGLFELFGIMAVLVPRDPSEEDGLWRGITL